MHMRHIIIPSHVQPHVRERHEYLYILAILLFTGINFFWFFHVFASNNESIHT